MELEPVKPCSGAHLIKKGGARRECSSGGWNGRDELQNLAI